MTHFFCIFNTTREERSEVLLQSIAKLLVRNRCKQRTSQGLPLAYCYSPDISSRHCLAVLLNDKSILVGLVQESAGGKEVLSFSERVLKSSKNIDYYYLSFMYDWKQMLLAAPSRIIPLYGENTMNVTFLLY